MNCPNCGQPVEQGAAFCGNCGQPLTVATPTPPTPPVPAAVGTPPTLEKMATTPIVSASIVPGALAPAGTGLPAYAVPRLQQANKNKETMAIIGVIAGVLSIPGALIPIVGLALGIAGIVLGSMSTHVKKTLAILGMVFGAIGLVAALGVWGYLISKDPKLHHATLSSSLQAVDTPCYSVKVSTSLHTAGDNDNCSMTAMDGKTTALSQTYFSIDGSNQPDVTASNFVDSAEKAAPTIVNEISTSSRTYTITSQKSDTFRGDPAYFIEAKSNQSTITQIEFVLHTAPNGDNLFVLSNSAVGSTADVHSLETNFSWK